MIKKIILTFFVIALYFFTRLQNLTTIPVFVDEAIYIRWSQIIKNVETLRFIPLTDGKQPLFMWMLVPLFKFFQDPLFAGRFLSVLSGFGTMVTLSTICVVLVNFQTKEKEPLSFVFSSLNKSFSLWLSTSFFYLLIPFAFFFDRMALPDCLLSFFGTVSLFFSLLLAKFKRLDLALILGFSLGLSWLTKSPAIYFIVLSAISFLIYNYKNPKSFIYPLISTGISFFIYNLLRLGPQFHMIAIRNKDYIWPVYEILKHPLDPLKPHISDIVSIYTQFISPLTIILASFLVIYLLLSHKMNRLFFIVTLWWLLPLICNAIFAKVFTSRYILFTLPPLMIFISSGLYQSIKNKKLLLFLFILLTPNLLWIHKVSTNPFHVNLPSTETGYLSDWTSGWGIKEASSYLIGRSKTENVIVGTEGYFGTLPDGLQIYTNNVPNLTVFGVGLGFSNIPDKLIDAKNHGDEVYLLINKSRVNLTSQEKDKLVTALEYKKPKDDSLILFRL